MLSKIQSVIQETLPSSPAFKEFTDNEKSAGVFLMICSIVALILANSPLSATYLGWWKIHLGPPGLSLSVSHWINDGLMAIFFLLIGLELKREVYVGELSDIKNATLPILAALGGISVPALIHFAFNRGLPTQSGFAIPMATDIAFVLSVLALAGNRVPLSLKIFLTAIAVIDDLCAIIVIALFYTADLNLNYLAMAGGVAALLVVINRLRVMSLIPYLLLGALMWFFMHESGIHATIAGVILAFAFPFRANVEGQESPMARLEQRASQTRGLRDSTDIRVRQRGCRHRRRRRGFTFAQRSGHYRGIDFWQIRRRVIGQLLRRQSRFGNITKRHPLEARHGRRLADWHRLHDVHFHHQSGI